MRNEFSKLAHDGGLSYQRGPQTANDFKQESQTVFPTMDLDSSGRFFGGFNKPPVVVRIQKQNAAQAGSPLETVQRNGKSFPCFVAKIDDGQTLQHA